MARFLSLQGLMGGSRHLGHIGWFLVEAVVWNPTGPSAVGSIAAKRAEELDITFVLRGADSGNKLLLLKFAHDGIPIRSGKLDVSQSPNGIGSRTLLIFQEATVSTAKEGREDDLITITP